MDLLFDNSVAIEYKSLAQISRIQTEKWVKDNIYCPACGNNFLDSCKNNEKVKDFLCLRCKSEYELKSKKNNFTAKVVDGAYQSMIKRINDINNPHFFFLNYSKSLNKVKDFFVIPKHYFTVSIIEKRRPLSSKAVRSGWIGCNILLKNIPESGKIFLIKDSDIKNREDVLRQWNKTSFLAQQPLSIRSWTIELLRLVESMPNKVFSLQELYYFEPALKDKFPNNNFIKDKIRQQLQFLRDKGLIEFKGNGQYCRL